MKDCGNHGERRRNLLRRLCAALLVFIFLALLTILIVWAVLHPSKPSFILQDATVYNFNVSTLPSLLTASFQVTITGHNTMKRVALYYDHLKVFAVYKNQQITLPTLIGSVFQGHKENTIWSPILYSQILPVAPFISSALSQDKENGMVMLLIKLSGKVRFHVAGSHVGHYRLQVSCPAAITFGAKSTGVGVGDDAVKYQLLQNCEVSV